MKDTLKYEWKTTVEKKLKKKSITMPSEGEIFARVSVTGG